MAARPATAGDRADLGAAETTYGPSVLATAAAALTMPPVVTMPARLGSGVVWSSTASMTWLIDQVGMGGLDQRDRAGDQGRGHRGAAIVGRSCCRTVLRMFTPGAASWTVPTP